MPLSRVLRVVTCVAALLVFAAEDCEGFHHVGRPALTNANALRVASLKMQSSYPRWTSSRDSRLFLSSRDDDSYSRVEEEAKTKSSGTPSTVDSLLQKVADSVQKGNESFLRRLPPLQVEDVNVLFYDTFLIINLAVSISFWVVHRMDLSCIGTAFNEGCLMSLLWISAGLYTGAFLNSAVDGHFGSASERGGPRAAGMLALNTYIHAVNLRLLFALVVAVVQHRAVGGAAGEQLMPLEIGFGVCLMIFWRTLHSSFVPRM
jgi:hypothetical protein